MGTRKINTSLDFNEARDDVATVASDEPYASDLHMVQHLLHDI